MAVRYPGPAAMGYDPRAAMRPEKRLRKRDERRAPEAPRGHAAPASDPGPFPLRRLAAGATVLLALTVAAYVPALQSGFIWDDDRYVTHNPLLGSWDGLREIWLSPSAMLQYYPLTHTTFWVEYQLWGLAPVGYHLVNVLLHGANAILVWLVLHEVAAPGAFLAGAVFAVHPVHVESVAWVSELKNVQSGVFYLLTVLGLVAAGRSRRPDAMALAAFLAAMLSKTVTCTLPVALLTVLWWRRGRVAGDDLRRLAPFALLGIVVGLPTIWMERRFVGAEGTEWALSPLDRCLVAGRAVWHYARTLVWPVDLAFVYPRWQVDDHAWWQYLFPLAAVTVLAALWAGRRRLGRAPFAGVLFFVVTLAPALGFFNLFPMRYSFVADHFQYLASIGPIALAAGGATAVVARASVGTRGRAIGRLAATAVVAILATLTWRQAEIYRSPELLWRDTLQKNPDSWMAHQNLGKLLGDEGRRDEAGEHFRRALALHPDFMEALYGLGNIAAAEGRYDEAADYYERGLAIDPLFPPLHNNLASVYAYQGKVAQAIAHYERALELLPDYPEARRNLNAVRSGAFRAPAP